MKQKEEPEDSAPAGGFNMNRFAKASISAKGNGIEKQLAEMWRGTLNDVVRVYGLEQLAASTEQPAYPGLIDFLVDEQVKEARITWYGIFAENVMKTYNFCPHLDCPPTDLSIDDDFYKMFIIYDESVNQLWRVYG